ncbi:hypothetical protein DFH06DRAFT_1136720 [Mycena polygramma]|nr:hypothetical protein DFH06DRAFT_1136720 [Mycena polygramma]
MPRCCSQKICSKGSTRARKSRDGSIGKEGSKRGKAMGVVYRTKRSNVCKKEVEEAVMPETSRNEMTYGSQDGSRWQLDAYSPSLTVLVLRSFQYGEEDQDRRIPLPAESARPRISITRQLALAVVWTKILSLHSIHPPPAPHLRLGLASCELQASVMQYRCARDTVGRPARMVSLAFSALIGGMGMGMEGKGAGCGKERREGGTIQVMSTHTCSSASAFFPLTLPPLLPPLSSPLPPLSPSLPPHISRPLLTKASRFGAARRGDGDGDGGEETLCSRK